MLHCKILIKLKILLFLSLKRKCGVRKDLEANRKLRYYKEVINPTLKDQKYLSVLTISKKKVNIAKIRTNSHDLHSEIGHWVVPKTPWRNGSSISVRI